MVNKMWIERDVVMASPIGAIKMTAREDAITSIDWTEESISATDDPLLIGAQKAIEDYFKGEKRTFDLPLSLGGTAFERAVYEATIKIPYGETCHYEDIAKAIGRAKAARAVGNALKKNRHLIVIPCHRVLPKSGGVGYYRGGGAAKELLLRLERGDRL